MGKTEDNINENILNIYPQIREKKTYFYFAALITHIRCSSKPINQCLMSTTYKFSFEHIL